MGLEFIDNEVYSARLDCKEAAIEGKCLMSYANTARNIYHRYGFVAEHNADVAYQNGSTILKLKPRKQIAKATEILWPYGKEIQMPTTVEEEQFARIGGCDVVNEWPFHFTRFQVIENLTDFQVKCPQLYIRAQNLLENCMMDTQDVIICTLLNNEFTTSKLSRCRPVPDIINKKGNKVCYLQTL